MTAADDHGNNPDTLDLIAMRGTAWAAAEIERLRAALRPFADGKLPSSARTETSYDRNGLRRAMSPLEIAMLRAYRAYLPLAPRPAKPCDACDNEPNCHCVRKNLLETSHD